MSVGVDVGGTFTDAVAWENGRLTVGKTSTTADQSEGVDTGTRAVLGDAGTELLVHGTTVATNALLERSGVEVVLVTDPGFEDLIEIGRQNRPSLYDPAVARRRPVVTRSARLSDLSGGIPASAGAVAVATIGGFADASGERAIAEQVRRLAPGVPVTSAGEEFGEFREFERFNTAAVNAYLRPTVERYLDHLSDRMVPDPARRLLVMRSSGGLLSPAEAGRLAAAILLSGPAGGVVATAALGRALGRSRVIAFDMGGTSTDVCRIEDGRPEVAYERLIDGQVVRMPSVAVHTVGAGGGSVAWADTGGALRVGPRSAGASPGPACYGRGGDEPTVTDADVVLGRIDGRAGLAGSVAIRPEAAQAAVAGLGRRLGLDPAQTASGIVEVVEATMERAVRAVSVEEGADPRQAVLVAFGGAGGLHATALARRLEMAGVVVPPYAGVFSALGLLLAPPRHESALSVLLTESAAERLDPVVTALADEARRRLVETTGVTATDVETVVDVRYLGQSHETPVPYRPGEGWAALAERFHRIHLRRNGFARSDDPIEAVTVRAAAVGVPVLTWDDLPSHRPVGEPELGSISVLDGGTTVDAGVFWRPGLAPGARVVGPAVVRDGEATIWLSAGEVGTMLDSGALEITW